MRQTFFEKHSVELVGGAIVLALVVAYKETIMQSLATQAELREQGAEIGKKTNQLMLSEQKKNQLAEIANDRMRNGCTMVYSINLTEKGELQYTAFGEGTPVVKGEFAELYKGKRITAQDNPNHFLPPGMTICSADGPTGILTVDGSLGNIAVVRDYAVATDPEAIRIAVERNRKAQSNVNKL